MHPEAVDRLRPRETNGFVHQEAAGTFPDRIGQQAEKGQFAVILFREIKLEQACYRAVIEKPIDVDSGVAKYPRELMIRHDEARIPQPVLADGLEEGAIGGEVGVSPAFDRETMAGSWRR